MKYQYHEAKYRLERYPRSQNNSLRPWSAAEEYMLQHLDGEDLDVDKLLICNDRFGFLNCHLNEFAPWSMVNNKSQLKAQQLNLKKNGLEVKEDRFVNPLYHLPSEMSLGVMLVPKSLDLFRLYLYQISQALSDEGEVLCSFMTRNFSPQLLSIANEFFDEVDQSRAWKKSRLMILSKKKSFQEIEILNTLKLGESKSLKQYFGVFSGKNIDYASQFLMEHLEVQAGNQRVLDLASGNGVLATCVQQINGDAEIHLLDDSWLAVESSKMNMDQMNTHFHWDDGLDEFSSEYFDLVISNPPFHFEYEIDVSVALNLFEQVSRCLKPGGHFQIVANRHLNYKVHLDPIFSHVDILAENEKFVVYDCW
ncbi:MAG: methyltransferase [Bacteroidales bacterium]|nr:methyltransferase [Bacteroidales bacterium]